MTNNIWVSNEVVRELAKEHRFKEIEPESEDCGFISFIRIIALGRIRINFYEGKQIIFLVITKDKQGYKNFRQAYSTNKYELVFKIFHNPNQFRDASK